MPVPHDMQPIGRDGELVLYADKQREYGILVDTVRNTESEKLDLQVFFKWGNFEAIDEEGDQ